MILNSKLKQNIFNDGDSPFEYPNPYIDLLFKKKTEILSSKCLHIVTYD